MIDGDLLPRGTFSIHLQGSTSNKKQGTAATKGTRTPPRVLSRINPPNQRTRSTMKTTARRRRSPKATASNIRRGPRPFARSSNSFPCGAFLGILALLVSIDPHRQQASPLAVAGFSLDHRRPAFASSRGSSSPASTRLQSAVASSENSSPATVNNNNSDAAADDWDGSTVVKMDNYDVVTVDLDAGRDYPIYIGTGYSDDEGTMFLGHVLPLCGATRWARSNTKHFVLFFAQLCCMQQLRNSS
jgi:hypothetical protein